MAISQLPTIAESWKVDNMIGNNGIQNTMIQNRFCKILQNLHFADNRQDDKTNKAIKMRPVIDHLNSKFFEVPSNDSEQGIDEHMVKFKGRSGMKQNIKSKLIKWLSSSGFAVRVNLVNCIRWMSTQEGNKHQRSIQVFGKKQFSN